MWWSDLLFLIILLIKPSGINLRSVSRMAMSSERRCGCKSPRRATTEPCTKSRRTTRSYSTQQIANALYTEFQLVMDGMPKRVCDGPADPFDVEFTEFDLKQLSKLLVELGRERRLYRRYLGEARAQRKKAFRAWCAFNQAETLNS